jgi:hypothetical protein
MANPQHLLKLLEGVDAWNEWRRQNPDLRPQLRDANLSRTDLSGAHLGGAHLGGANLYSANLNRANLCGANLVGVDFSDAELNGADFTGAWAASVKFINIDMRGVVGLDSVLHSGPSTVGVDTIYKSNGNIPRTFLRGCGVPEALITYTAADHDFAERLSVDMEASGIRCWFTPHHVASDEWIGAPPERSIQMYDKLLLVLSKNSMNSPWLRREIEAALNRELSEDRRVIYPVSICSLEELGRWRELDPSTGRDQVRQVRERFIPNFSNWQDHYSYRQVLGALLRDLEDYSTVLPTFSSLHPQLVQAVA